MNARRLAGTSAFLATLMLGAPALAHQGQAGGFLTGLAHPVSGLDHIAAMVAVGLWGAQLGRPALWLLPVAFPMVMAFGAFLALVGIAIPGVEVGVAASAVLLGLMVLLEASPPLPVSVLMVSVFAIFHGHAHGAELPANQSGLAYSAGFVICTGLLHATGIAIGAIHRWRAGALAVRLLGGIIMSGGLYFLWRTVA